jgi:hypothetical protein
MTESWLLCTKCVYCCVYIYIYDSTWICCVWEKWDSRNCNNILILLCKSCCIKSLFILCEHDCAQTKFFGLILIICSSLLGTSFCFYPRLISFLHKFVEYSKWTTPLDHQSTDVPCKLSSFVGDVELRSAWTQPRRQKEVLGTKNIRAIPWSSSLL